MGASPISGAKAALELQGLSGIFFLWSCCELLTCWLQLSLAAQCHSSQRKGATKCESDTVSAGLQLLSGILFRRQ